ncbi:hypothetical protein, partial [Paracoccus pantotrophus]
HPSLEARVMVPAFRHRPIPSSLETRRRRIAACLTGRFSADGSGFSQTSDEYAAEEARELVRRFTSMKEHLTSE